MNLIEMFNLGGPFMWILLVFSIATFALIIERCVYLFWHDCKVDGLAKEVKMFLVDGKNDEALKMLEKCTRKKNSCDSSLCAHRKCRFWREPYGTCRGS